MKDKAEKQKPTTKAGKATKIMKSIISVISIIILLFSVVTYITVMVARAKNEVPTLFGYSFHVVVTDSMTPEIKVGDLVVAKKVDISEVKVGDDVVFVSPDPSLHGIMIVHRAVKVNDDGTITTKGIKLGAREDAYPVSQIQGVRVATSTFFGKIMKIAVSKPQYIFLVVLIVIGIVIISEVISIVTLKKKGKPAEEEKKDTLSPEEIKRIEEEARREAAEMLRKERENGGNDDG